MENKWHWLLITAIAPVAWGASYFVTSHTLPADAPLWGAAIRALPAGLILMAFARRRPRGVWWWRSGVLGLLNVAAFFALVYVAAQLLPSSVATSVQALAPVALAGFAWALASERPTARIALGALLGIGGVLLVVGTGGGRLDWLGVAAAVVAVALSSLSGVLAKRWADGTPVIAVAAWQLVLGGALLVPFAFGFEGTPPVVDGLGWAGYAYMAVVATALAYWAWFTGLSRLPAGTVGIVGLLNPVTGVLLGTLAAGELLGWLQWLGIALVLVGILVGQGRSRTQARTRTRTQAGTRLRSGTQTRPISSPDRSPQFRRDVNEDADSGPNRAAIDGSGESLGAGSRGSGKNAPEGARIVA